MAHREASHRRMTVQIWSRNVLYGNGLGDMLAGAPAADSSPGTESLVELPMSACSAGPTR